MSIKIPNLFSTSGVFGGSKRGGAQFYLLNYDTAKKMERLFTPFNHSSDIWMNEVLRRGNIKSFWSEPSLLSAKLNKQTSTLVDKNKILYRMKSKIINKVLDIFYTNGLTILI